MNLIKGERESCFHFLNYTNIHLTTLIIYEMQ